MLQRLSREADIALTLAPSGLFAGGGRTMDAQFAAYAWSNDQRIAKLTGQRFTEAYRTQVLGQQGTPFDSMPTTLALTAVSLTEPSRELGALTQLQEARYVHGLDTVAPAIIATQLRTLDLHAAADRLLTPDEALREENTRRIHAAQSLMRQHHAQGVPALVVRKAASERLLQGNALYGTYDALLAALAQD